MCLCINGYVMVENECRSIDNCLKVKYFGVKILLVVLILSNFHIKTFYSAPKLDRASTKTTSSNVSVKKDTHSMKLIVSILMSALQTHTSVVKIQRALTLLEVIHALV